MEMNMDEYRGFWNNKRETTATSPFGLHIGHYKTALDTDRIANIHLALLFIPFKYAYVPTRWAQTIQVMLEKDVGSPWTHRLRIIELFDAQLNAGMQVFFGKRMVNKALHTGNIHPSAYGSVPHRTAQDAVLKKTITLDMMRLTKTNGAILDCDAHACFDRIVLGL